METSARFQNAIQALVKAYLNGTLGKGSCRACAIGNICANAIGTKVISVTASITKKTFVWEQGRSEWEYVFATGCDGLQRVIEENYKGEAKRQIDSTGYSWQELARIEKAFEQNTGIYYLDYQLHSAKEIDADQFNGLCAVVDVLCEIEGIGDPTEYKALFAKA